MSRRLRSAAYDALVRSTEWRERAERLKRAAGCAANAADALSKGEGVEHSLSGSVMLTARRPECFLSSGHL
jgi:hypothetical protein